LVEQKRDQYKESHLRSTSEEEKVCCYYKNSKIYWEMWPFSHSSIYFEILDQWNLYSWTLHPKTSSDLYFRNRRVRHGVTIGPWPSHSCLCL